MAAQSATYPEGLNEALAEAFAHAADAKAGRAQSPARECHGLGKGGVQRGGRLAEGAALAGE
eukprot:3404636-Pleurochrysis_carterae.AAC.1